MNLGLETCYVRIVNRSYFIKINTGYIVLEINEYVINRVIYKRHLISTGVSIILNEETKQQILDKWPHLSFCS